MNAFLAGCGLAIAATLVVTATRRHRARGREAATKALVHPLGRVLCDVDAARQRHAEEIARVVGKHQDEREDLAESLVSEAYRAAARIRRTP